MLWRRIFWRGIPNHCHIPLYRGQEEINMHAMNVEKEAGRVACAIEKCQFITKDIAFQETCMQRNTIYVATMTKYT